VHEVARKANLARSTRLADELAVMRPLTAVQLPEFVELDVPVAEWSTIRVKHRAYSVPSRLIGERVRVRLYEERVEVYFAGQLQLRCERLRGDGKRHRIDYRHVIWSLVQKPGAFERYVYRDEMFPSVVFRRAYDAIQTPHRGVPGDLEYLRILHLAASTVEADVEAALELLLAEDHAVTADAAKALVRGEHAATVPPLEPPAVDLGAYDELLAEVAS
jgi:hypothetical protein